MSTNDNLKEQLLNDLNAVIKDAEELLHNSEQQAGEGFKSARAKFESTLRNAKRQVVHVEEMVVAKTKEAAKATDVYVKENPWQSVGIAAGVGLLLGMLIGRNK